MKTIWAKTGRDEMNVSLLFQAELCGLSGDVKLKIAAENLYRIYVFDRFTGYGPQRSAAGITRVDELDLTGLVRDGKLIITVEVSAYNVFNYYVIKELPFFGAEIYNNGSIIADTDDFTAYRATDRLQKVQRFCDQRGFVESYVEHRCRNYFYRKEEVLFPVVECEPVDHTRLMPRDVNYPTFETIYASPSGISGGVEIDENAEIIKDYMLNAVGVQPFREGYGKDKLDESATVEISRFKYENGAANCAGKYTVYDFGRDVSGFLGFRINVTKKSTVYLIFDEILVNGMVDPRRFSVCPVIKYVLDPGLHELLSFEANTMRYVNFVIFGDNAAPEKMFMRLYENPDAGKLVFKSDDAELNGIFEAARSTFAQNAVDLLTDCPSRERAGWLCDSYFSGQAEVLFTGKSLIEHAFLQNYADAPKDPDIPDGMLHMCYPANHPNGKYIPNWCMWFVLELEKYLENTGDRKLIDDLKPKVLAMFDSFKTYENEFLLLESLGSWVFIEWSFSNKCVQDVSFPSNMLYAGVLEAADRLYGIPEFSKKAAKIRDAINRLSWNGEFYIDNAMRTENGLELTENTTETCQYYALYFGLADENNHPELIRTMVENFGAKRDYDNVYPNVPKSNAFIGNFLRLDYLRRAGFREEALRQCREYFGFMVEQTGTLWEYDLPSASCCHCFASYVANIMTECIFGLTSIDRVNKTVRFGALPAKIDCEIDIPIENDHLKITLKDGKRTVSLPAGYTNISAS